MALPVLTRRHKGQIKLLVQAVLSVSLSTLLLLVSAIKAAWPALCDFTKGIGTGFAAVRRFQAFSADQSVKTRERADHE